MRKGSTVMLCRDKHKQRAASIHPNPPPSHAPTYPTHIHPFLFALTLMMCVNFRVPLVKSASTNASNHAARSECAISLRGV